MMNKTLVSSIVECYAQPETSVRTTRSPYGLSVYVASVCELPESVVTDTLTTEIRFFKPNGTIFKDDVYSKLDCTTRPIVGVEF